MNHVIDKAHVNTMLRACDIAESYPVIWFGKKRITQDADDDHYETFEQTMIIGEAELLIEGDDVIRSITCGEKVLYHEFNVYFSKRGPDGNWIDGLIAQHKCDKLAPWVWEQIRKAV